jgi:hypothetical protein
MRNIEQYIDSFTCLMMIYKRPPHHRSRFCLLALVCCTYFLYIPITTIPKKWQSEITPHTTSWKKVGRLYRTDETLTKGGFHPTRNCLIQESW